MKTEKYCWICKETKPVTEFYTDMNRGRDFLATKCKPCERKYQREKRERNKANYVKKERRYYQNHREDIMKRRKENTDPVKLRARQMVRKAVLSGKLKRPEICFDCGLKKRTHGHHEDYSKPLAVIWLCAKCHSNRHHGIATVTAST